MGEKMNPIYDVHNIKMKKFKISKYITIDLLNFGVGLILGMITFPSLLYVGYFFIIYMFYL